MAHNPFSGWRIRIRTPVGLLALVGGLGVFFLEWYETANAVAEMLPSWLKFAANPLVVPALLVIGIALILWEIHDVRKTEQEHVKKNLENLGKESAVIFGALAVVLLAVIGVTAMITSVRRNHDKPKTIAEGKPPLTPISPQPEPKPAPAPTKPPQRKPDHNAPQKPPNKETPTPSPSKPADISSTAPTSDIQIEMNNDALYEYLATRQKYPKGDEGDTACACAVQEEIGKRYGKPYKFRYRFPAGSTGILMLPTAKGFVNDDLTVEGFTQGVVEDGENNSLTHSHIIGPPPNSPDATAAVHPLIACTPESPPK
jgi:hypothetical protein